MSLIKKPSELEVNPTLTALIYGNPGIGKSTLACSAPSPVLFDFDGGVNRMAANHKVDTVQIKSWEDALAALDEVVADPGYKTIIVDTLGKMMNYIEDYIKRTMATNTAYFMRDGSLSLKGFGKRKQIFSLFNSRLKMAGRHIIYVAHETERTQKVANEEITIKRPEIGGSLVNELMKELDLVGYMQAYGTVRKITFDPQESFYAKNSCGINGVVDVPMLFDAQGNAIGQNNFMQGVVDGYRRRQENGQKQTIAFDALMSEVKQRVGDVNSADDANAFMTWAKGAEHIFDSKVKIWAAISEKAKALGLTYDQSNGQFNAAR